MSHRLIVCAQCSRHVRFGESCPFCGAEATHEVLTDEREVRLHRAALVGLSVAVAAAVSMCAPYGLAPLPDTGVRDSGVAQDASGMDASDQ